MVLKKNFLQLMKILHINVKKEYFYQIKSGEKIFEFRLCEKVFWQKRLIGKHYDLIHIKLGYPKNGDKERIIERPYMDFSRFIIKHKHFGIDPVKVFAIKVN